MSGRNEYPLELTINDKLIHRLIIDQHYKEKHHGSVNDSLILDLVKTIDGETFEIERENGIFQYFTAEPVFKDDKPYRLVLLLCVCDDYLGVINAFRVDRKD